MPGSDVERSADPGAAPRILILHSSNLRVPAANTVQVTRMGAAFAHTGARVRLLYPAYTQGNQLQPGELARYYGVEEVVESGYLELAPLRSLFTSGMFRPTHLARLLPFAKLVAFLVELLRLRLVERQAPDLLYTRCYAAAYFLPRLRFLLPRRAGSQPRGQRPPVVLEVHELPQDARRLRALQRVDALVVISQALAYDLRRHFDDKGLNPLPPTLVAPDGVPSAWLEELPRDAARDEIAPTLEAQSLRLDPRLPLGVITGSLPAGAVDVLFRTARALRGKAEVLAVGAPRRGRVDDLRAAARRDGLSNLHFLGPVPPSQVRTYQAAADVLLAPYTGELSWAAHTSPLKLFEYMAAGRPMVVSDLPVLREVLEPDGNAVLVPLGEEGGLASGVERVLGDAELGKRVASRARERVEGWTWERRAEGILGFAGGL